MADQESPLMMDESDGTVVTCWACNILVAAPLGTDGLAAPVFKCGWCGAVNDLQQRLEDKEAALANGYQPWQQPRQQEQGSYRLHLPSAHKQYSSCPKQHRSSLARHVRCLGSACMVGCRWAVVALVALLVASIAGTGIILLLPRLCTTWATYLPNLAVSVYLCICVAVNYAAAVLQSPGRVSECVPPPQRGPHGQVLQGSYELYSFCRHCRAAKPPAVHHCSACRHCVVDMDHHCPFINNCVGRGNLRPFLLFLMWTVLAAAYVLAMCSVLVWREWDVVRESAVIHSSLNQGSFGALTNSSSNSGGSSNARSSFSSPELAAGASISPAAHSTAALSSSSSSSGVHMAAAGQQAAAGWSSARLVASGGMLLLLLQLAPGWLLATYYLAAACAALLLAVSALLVSQLNYLGSGVTYIQHLKRAAGSAAAAAGSGSGHAAAAARGADSSTEQANSNGSACNGMQQVCAEQTDAAGSATAAATVVSGARKQMHVQQVLQRQFGKWQVLWARLKEVLGVGSGSGFALSKALLVPQWQPATSAGVSTAVKKWS